MNKKDYLRLCYKYLSLIYAHSCHLIEVYKAQSPPNLYRANYFSTLCFDKPAVNVRQDGGAWKRYAGTSPFLTDCALVFYKVGCVGSYDAKTDGYRDKNHFFLDEAYRGIDRCSLALHLSGCADACVGFIAQYGGMRGAGFCLIDHQAADDAYYNARTGSARGILKFIKSCIEEIG